MSRREPKSRLAKALPLSLATLARSVMRFTVPRGDRFGIRAAIAQLVEHLIRNEGVGSSNLSCGTKHFKHLACLSSKSASQKFLLGSAWEAARLQSALRPPRTGSNLSALQTGSALSPATPLPRAGRPRRRLKASQNRPRRQWRRSGSAHFASRYPQRQTRPHPCPKIQGLVDRSAAAPQLKSWGSSGCAWSSS